MTHAGNGTVNGPDGKPFKTRQGALPRLSSLLDEVVELARQRLDEHDLATDVPDEERNEVARLVGLAAIKFGELSNHRTTDYSFDLQRFTQMQGRAGPYLLYVAVRTKSILARLASQGVEPGAFVPPTHDKERHILSADDPTRQRSWLALVALTQRVLVNALEILTIDVPDRM